MSFDIGTLLGKLKLDTSGFEDSAKSATGKVDGLGSKLASFGKVAVLGAAAGVATLATGIGFAVKAFGEAETAQKQLEHATLDVAHGTKEQLTALEDLSTELEKKGVLDGDNIKTGLAQLQTFGLSAEMVRQLGGSMADLAVNQFGVNATSEDLTSTANMMAKALNGDFGVLEKSGIRFTEAQQKMIQFGTETERATAMQQGLAQNLKFTNEVAVQTTEGGLAKMKVSIGNITESIGGLFAPMIVQATQKITALADYLSVNFAPIFKNMKERFTNFFLELDAKTGIITLLKDQFNHIVDLWVHDFIPLLIENKQLFIDLAKFIGGVLIVAIAALAISIRIIADISIVLLHAIFDVKDAFGSLGDRISKFANDQGLAFQVIVQNVSDSIQKIIDFVWKLPGEFSNAFTSAVDKAKSALSNIPVIGGIASTLAKIAVPRFASGVQNFGGGLAVVGENGAELVNLPRGSSVTPNDKLAGMGMTVNVNVSGNTVQSDQGLADMVAQSVMDSINRRQEKNQLFGTV